jgi:hypothetical protein
VQLNQENDMTSKIKLEDLSISTELGAEALAARRGGFGSTAAALRAQRETMLRYTVNPYSTARYTVNPYSTARYTVSPYSTARYSLNSWSRWF